MKLDSNTKKRVMLKKKLKERRIDQKEFIKQINCSEGYFSQIMNGRQPSNALSRKIFNITGINLNN